MVSSVGGPPGGKPPGSAPGDDGEEDSAIYNQLKKFINVIVSTYAQKSNQKRSWISLDGLSVLHWAVYQSKTARAKARHHLLLSNICLCSGWPQRCWCPKYGNQFTTYCSRRWLVGWKVVSPRNNCGPRFLTKRRWCMHEKTTRTTLEPHER